MIRNTTISAERAWYTWSPRPLEMVFLPLGVRITPLGFSGSAGQTTLYPSGAGLRFGRHTLDGKVIEARATHAGTELAWFYRKPDPYRIIGAWKSLAHGEWGLRYWVNICLSAGDRSVVVFDQTDGAAIVKVGHRFVALVGRDDPVQVTGHETIEAAAHDYEQHGYFSTRSRAQSAPVIMLRYNLEMMRDGNFAVAVADDRKLAVARARSALDLENVESSIASHTGRLAGSLDAIRDVMAWNTVWDEVNDRPYTSISRNWNLSKFGGFGVWLNDQLYHALLTSLFDQQATRDNIGAALAGATPQGNIACLVSANDAWVDRTQVPLGAFLVWMIYLRCGARELLELAYPALARNHEWWWRCRDPEGLNLCSYGTSDVGEGLYKGTAFGARNESNMDNSPIHDEAVYDIATRTLTTLDVGLNSALALDAEMLSAIAAELGKTDQAVNHTAVADRTRNLIRTTLWDETRGIFANRLRRGGFVRSLSPTSFYPLAAGAATPAQLERLLGHLLDPSSFGGNFVIPSVSRDDLTYRDNTYWRGRVWPPLNYFVWQGLRRYGRYVEASALAEASLDLFRRSWIKDRSCPENYNAETGEGLDQPDTDSFYSWGALMPLMSVGEISDVSIWNGWEIVNNGDDVSLGPIETPIGQVSIAVERGRLSLRCGQESLFETTLRGRLARIVWERSGISMILPAFSGVDAEIAFPSLSHDDVTRLTMDGRDAPFHTSGKGIGLVLAPSDNSRLLILHRNL